MPLADRVRAAGTRTGPIIVGAIVLQWLSTLCAVTFESNHAGWRFEQSRDALASVQGAFALADGDLPRQGPGLLWPIAMSPFASVADTLDGVLVGAVLLNVLVLAPLALVSVYWVAARIGGRLLGAWTVVLWVLGPWVLMLAGLERYDPVIRDRVLPLVLGLTAEPAFPAAVALVSSAALIATSLDRRSLGGAALAGLLAGAATAIEPHSLLFLGGAAGAYVASRRIPEAGAFALALVPAVLAVAAVDRARRRRTRPTLLRPRGLGPVHGEHGRAARVLLEPASAAVASNRGDDRRRAALAATCVAAGRLDALLRRRPGITAWRRTGRRRDLPRAAPRPAGLRPPRGRDSTARPDTLR